MDVTGIAIFQGQNVTAPGSFITVTGPDRVRAGDRVLDVIRMDTGSPVGGNFGPVATDDGIIHQFQGSLSGIMLLAYFGR